MKKSLVALAVMAAAGAASAQSSVTLFGGVDIMVGNYRTATLGSATKVNTSGLYSSRLGFRGVEDLGGGMKAGFWLEAGLNPDAGLGQGTSANNQTGSTNNGGIVFNRRSTASLMGGWGEVRLGRDFTPAFWNKTVFDPFGTLGVAQASNLDLAGTAPQTGVRASNSIGYLFNQNNGPVGNGGFYGQLQLSRGENTSGAATSSDGNGVGFRAGFEAGPVNAALAYGNTKMAAANSSYKELNLAGSYDLRVVKLMAQYARNDSGVAGTRYNNYLLGATIPVGAGYIPVSYNRVKQNNAAGSKASQLGIGYVHNLSKRTSLYTSYARISNKNGAAYGVSGGVGGAANQNSSGFEVGVKHSF